MVQPTDLPPSPDYPKPHAFWWPAHPANFGTATSGYRRINVPVAIILHTPEEDADDREITPIWFQNPAARASTHYYGDSDGDIIQMVLDQHAAYANGVRTETAVYPSPVWRRVGTSYNCMTLSIEIEGRAASIHHTLKIGGVQWNSLIEWILFKADEYSIPLDRQHIMGHFELANNRTDPGPKFPWDELMDALTAPSSSLPPELTARNARWVAYGKALTKYDGHYIRPVRQDDRFVYYMTRYRRRRT